MLVQCWVLFLLKCTLLRRSWSKRNFWGYILLGLLLFCGAVLSLITSIAFYFLAHYAARDKSHAGVLILFDSAIAVYLFFYIWGVLMDLQRSDMIDFRKMLLLPVRLPAIYLMNFAVSMISPIMLFAIPSLFAILAGLYPVYGIKSFIAGIPFALLFMLVMNSWAYYLRGRLAIIMENKRKRRIAMVVLPICFVTLGQLPALLSHLATLNSDDLLSHNVIDRILPYLLTANVAFPLLWPAYGIWLFINGAFFWNVLSMALGLCLCALLGLRLGYVSTLNHYMGMENMPLNSRLSHAYHSPAIIPRTGRRFFFFSDDTSTLILAFYYSFARHPHIRMLIIMPLCLGLFFMFMYRTGAYGGHLHSEGAWMPMAALVWPFLNFSLFMFNIFGADAQSFSALTLFPTQRRKYVIAKNMALAPFVLGLSFFFVVVSTLLANASLRLMLMALILALHLFFLLSTIGNFLSLRFPYRIGRDALRQPTKRLRMLIIGIFSTLLVAFVVIPSSACMLLERSRFSQGRFIPGNAGMISAVLLLVLSVIIYCFTITSLGDQFTEREQDIYSRLIGDKE